MKTYRTSAPILFLLTSLLAVGCGSNEISDGRVPASGTVTLDGKPLEKGSIGFIGADGSTGVGIIKDGKFTVTQSANSSGTMPGTYKVSVASWKVEPGTMDEDGTITKAESTIPEKYNDVEKSGLTATIADGGSSDIVIELKSDK